LAKECEDVAADEQLREQAHAHDGMVLGAHHARQAPEHHVNRSSYQRRRDQGEGALNDVRAQTGSVVVGGCSTTIADHFDYRKLSAKLGNKPCKNPLGATHERFL
jgi:hypothetical protein